MKRFEATVIPAIVLERRSIHCPKCHVPMSLTTVVGISVEKCPSCEGTFFDKGELESVIHRKTKLRSRVFDFSWAKKTWRRYAKAH